MKISRTIEMISVTAVALLVVGCGAPERTSSAAAGKVASPSNQVSDASPQAPVAPEFSMPALNGTRAVSLKQLLGKQPILINVWASWCGPCKEETPDLVKLASQYQGKIQVIGVNMTSTDNLKSVKQFVEKFGVKYPVLLDTKGQFESSYGIQGFPTTFLISPDGKVLNVNTGAFINLHQMEAFVALVIH